MSDSFKQIILQDLIQDEGFHQFAYKDSLGKLTIGIGRNLESCGISKDEAIYLANNDIDDCINEVRRSFPAYETLNDARKIVLINMTFNLGISKLMQFRKMLDAIEAYDFHEASKQMLDSEWAKQVRNRSARLALIMERGLL